MLDYGAFNNQQMEQAAMEYRGGADHQVGGKDNNDRSNIATAVVTATAMVTVTVMATAMATVMAVEIMMESAMATAMAMAMAMVTARRQQLQCDGGCNDNGDSDGD